MPEHRGVSAAEKYAELLALGQERPRCACHGEAMAWRCDGKRSGGGGWRCAVAKRNTHRRYVQNNPERVQESCLLYRTRNRAQIRERRRIWYWENRESEARRNRLWRKTNPEKDQARNARRIIVSGMYLGACAFNQTEVEAMLNGTSD